MTDSTNPYTMRVIVPVAVGVMIGMSTGRTVGTAVVSSIGYFGALLVNMLTAGVVAVLVTMPLVYCLTARQPKN